MRDLSIFTERKMKELEHLENTSNSWWDQVVEVTRREWGKKTPEDGPYHPHPARIRKVEVIVR